mgnify:CR=1 FL=1
MRVAVYARVSTEHEAQINALENQLEWYKIECSRHSARVFAHDGRCSEGQI